MFQAKVIVNIKEHILCSVTSPHPPRKSIRLWYNVEKYGESGQSTGDNIGPNAAHALRMLDNWGY